MRYPTSPMVYTAPRRTKQRQGEPRIRRQNAAESAQKILQEEEIHSEEENAGRRQSATRSPIAVQRSYNARRV